MLQKGLGFRDNCYLNGREWPDKRPDPCGKVKA